LSVEDINPPHTRRAKEVMCCGDQTIVKVDEALINSKILSIAANNDTICKHFRININYFKHIISFSTLIIPLLRLHVIQSFKLSLLLILHVH
jgi:hypothetical protein